MSKSNPWQEHLARDRQRSAEARRAAREVGRPSSHQVAIAIADAMQQVWSEHVDDRLQTRPCDEWRRAVSIPIALDKVVERAVEILVQHKRADRLIAAKLVMRRVRPKQPPLRVPKANPPLTTSMTSYS